LSDELNNIKKPRRFQRIGLNIEVNVFSVSRDLMGKGQIVDISASGIKFETQIEKGISKFGELRVSFCLPDGSEIAMTRGEVKALTKLALGWIVRLKFAEPKTVLLLKDYIEKRTSEKKGNDVAEFIEGGS